MLFIDTTPIDQRSLAVVFDSPEDKKPYILTCFPQGNKSGRSTGLFYWPFLVMPFKGGCKNKQNTLPSFILT